MSKEQVPPVLGAGGSLIFLFVPFGGPKGHLTSPNPFLFLSCFSLFFHSSFLFWKV